MTYQFMSLRLNRAPTNRNSCIRVTQKAVQVGMVICTGGPSQHMMRVGSKLNLKHISRKPYFLQLSYCIMGLGQISFHIFDVFFRMKNANF